MHTETTNMNTTWATAAASTDSARYVRSQSTKARDPEHHLLSRLVTTLATEADMDWDRPAGILDWSVTQTVNHLVDVYVWYAVQVASAATAHTRLDSRPPVAASNADRLVALTAAEALLDCVLHATPPQRQARHHFGPREPASFRLMAAAETAVHGHDICTGLGLPWRPADHETNPLLSGLFSNPPVDTDPWTTLLWAHGRTDLADRPRRPAWAWGDNLDLDGGPTGHPGTGRLRETFRP